MSGITTQSNTRTFSVRLSELIYERRIAAKLKEKIYKLLMRPVIIYGLETGTDKKNTDLKR